MSEATVATSPDDLLKLTFCPNCDYSLQTLPSVGICPECGEHYDQSFVVLRGAPASDRDHVAMTSGAFTSKRLIWMFAGMCLLLFVFPHGYQNPLFLFMCGYLALTAAVGMLTRLDSPRPGEILVWMSADGIGQQVDTDQTTLAARIRPFVPVVYSLGFPLFMILPGMHSRTSAIFAISFAIPLIGISLALRLGGRPRLALKPAGVRPGLVAWRDFKFIELREKAGGSLTIRAHHVSWANRRDIVDIKMNTTHECTAAIRQRLRSWATCELREK